MAHIATNQWTDYFTPFSDENAIRNMQYNLPQRRLFNSDGSNLYVLSPYDSSVSAGIHAVTKYDVVTGHLSTAKWSGTVTIPIDIDVTFSTPLSIVRDGRNTMYILLRRLNDCGALLTFKGTADSFHYHPIPLHVICLFARGTMHHDAECELYCLAKSGLYRYDSRTFSFDRNDDCDANPIHSVATVDCIVICTDYVICFYSSMQHRNHSIMCICDLALGRWTHFILPMLDGRTVRIAHAVINTEATSMMLWDTVSSCFITLEMAKIWKRMSCRELLAIPSSLCTKHALGFADLLELQPIGMKLLGITEKRAKVLLHGFCREAMSRNIPNALKGLIYKYFPVNLIIIARLEGNWAICWKEIVKM